MIKNVIKYRVWIIVFAVIFTAFFSIGIFKLKTNAGPSSLVPEDNDVWIYFKKMERLFGGDDQIVVGVTFDDTVYTAKNIALIDEITMLLKSLDEVDEDAVLSLTAIKDISRMSGRLKSKEIVDEGELTEKTLSSIKETVENNPLLRGKIVSEDGKSALISVGVHTKYSLDEKHSVLLKNKLESEIASLSKIYPNAEINLSGMPIITGVISEYMTRDLKRLFPIAIVVVIILLYFLLRTSYGVIAPILVTLISVIFTFGLKGFIGSDLTIVETVIPVMLIAIGCADGVHIVSEFLSCLKLGYKPKEAIEKTMSLLGMPVVMTSLTTALGFASLLVAPGVSIKNMGIFLTFGVIVAMVFSLTFIPALLSFYHGKKHAVEVEKTPSLNHGIYASIMDIVGHIIIRLRFVIFVFVIITLGLSIIGIFRLEVEADEIAYFKKDNPVRMATKRIEKTLGGVVVLDIIIEGNERGSLNSPTILRAMEKLQEYCDTFDIVSYTLSIADFIKRINYVLHNNNEEYNRIPNEIEIVDDEEIKGSSQIAQFAMLYRFSGGDEMNRLVDKKFQTAKISVRLKDTSIQKQAAMVEKIRTYASENLPKNVTMRFSNHFVRIVVADIIVKSQINSLIAVLVAILILLSILFRSPISGLLIATPVFLAILFNFAVMWLFGVRLNLGTSLIASVGMGVGIDYAIHYYARFKMLFKQNGDYEKSAIEAIKQTARAILSNAAAVGIGFMVLIFSEYHIIADVGWITALSMFTTAASSLVVLPALITAVRPKIR